MTPSIVLRSLQVGDIGWVTHRQGLLYAQEYGLDGPFEALVAEIAAQFVKHFDPLRENAWIAECKGQVVGSVFLVRVSDEEAKLRLLYVEPEARGAGLGLVSEESHHSFGQDLVGQYWALDLQACAAGRQPISSQCA